MTIAGLQQGNIFYPFLPPWLQLSQSRHSQHNGAGFPSSNHSHVFSCDPTSSQVLQTSWSFLLSF
ncbi:hypothetical protein T4A_6520 [Trichinella pseudospiralis]|uniref:Uncharacterized protein n=1 Tax=Trichinella pseudospiralis TaxID=6337 RepID=A0A0V1G2N8_TRIPS|nr:hypothetical protein T4A_6520 [Trichinella pseudospiralis]KRY91747.1 hypothetical protein T4D_3036 [Trichinella pseudospiralis]